MDLLAANKGEKDGEEYGFADAIKENKLTVAGIAIAVVTVFRGFCPVCFLVLGWCFLGCHWTMTSLL